MTTDENPGANFSIHARILTAIRGDGTPGGTTLTFVNPSGGRVERETLAVFLPKFEAEARDPKRPLRIQVVHWPESVANQARLTHSQSFVGVVTAQQYTNHRGIQRPGTGANLQQKQQIAAEILEFFYPGMSFPRPVSNDGIELAAAIFRAALEKQRMLNRLPKPPGTRPGVGWLVKEGVMIFWRELRGPTGFTAAVRNQVAREWRTGFEEYRNGLRPTMLTALGSAFSVVDALTSDIPLDPGHGGMSIGPDALEMGDIILSTGTGTTSALIRYGTNSPTSHSALYVGNTMVVEAVGEGVQHVPLASALADDQFAVAVRYPDLTDTQRLKIRDFAGQQIGQRYDHWGIVKQAGFQLDNRVFCSRLTGDERARCRRWVGRVNLGTATNDAWFCSELVVAAYADAGVPLTTEPPHWASPSDLTELHLSARLGYVGHLKTP